MAANSLRSELEDPFTCSSIVSLLPRTLGVPLLAPPAASESQEMEKAKSLVESIILNGMKATLEQAQNIHNSCQSVVSSSQELDTASNPGPDVDFSILKHIRDPEEYFRAHQRLEEADKEIKRLRGEVPSESSKNQWITKRKPRPGLLGTYTFKPTSSLFPTATTSKECIASQQLKERTTSLSNSNPGPDVDFSILKHIRDPEEYFRTHQRLEEADKEIKRLRGEVPSESLKNQPITKRKPRPGLRGGTYTLKPPLSLFPTATTSKECTASQQLEERTTSPSKASTRTESNENTNPNSIDQAHNLDSMETNNFIAAVEEKVLEEKDKNDFEKLISAFKDLNGDEARALLFETLQIKPIEIKKLELPKLPTSQRPLGKSLDINQLPQNSQTLLKKPDDFLAYWRRDLLDNVYMKPQPDDSSYSGDSSPNTSRQKKPVTSPVDVSYSDQIGLLTSNTSLPATAADKNLSLVNELQTPFNKVDETSDKIAAKEAGRDQAQFSPETITGRVTNVERCSDAINKQKEDAGEDAHHLDPKGMDLTPGFANNSYRSRLAVTVDSIGDDHIASGSDNDANRFIDDNLQAQITVRGSDIPLASTQAYIENSISMETILPVDVQSQDASLVAGKNVETHGSNATSGMSTNNKKKQKVSSGRKTKQKQKSISRRQSLADAGMIWEFGVRRSTRMKSRPLEFWRGEKFLYGRIHDSLATVIGVKLASPGNDGLKVKSFVSEQYADLVARAALH